MRRVPRLRASGLAVSFALIAGVIPLAFVVPTLLGTSQSIVEKQAAEALDTAARGASNQLSRVLYARWSELHALSEFARVEESEEALRLRMETIKATNGAYAWLGLANVSGRVSVATGNLLQGQSVAERPWFKAGLEGSYAGDVHEAVLLRNLLPVQGTEPLRLIDLAMPILRGNGDLVGVLGTHLAWTWLADLIHTASKDSGVDLTLVTRDGTVLVGPPALEGKRLTTQSAFAARQGTATTNIETWPDGDDYLVSVVPATVYRDLPSFGWSLIARTRSELAFAPVHRMTASLAPALFGSLVALAIAAVLLGRMLGRPISRMADAAVDIAAGRCSQPVTEERRFREVAELSASLSKLQSMVQAAQKPASKEGTLDMPNLKLVRTAS
jgi:HAMP domain-containing protein